MTKKDKVAPLIQNQKPVAAMCSHKIPHCIPKTPRCHIIIWLTPSQIVELRSDFLQYFNFPFSE